MNACAGVLFYLISLSEECNATTRSLAYIDNFVRNFIIIENLDPVHTGPDPYGHHINLKSLKTSMTLKFVIILQNLIRKSDKSKYDRKLTELDVETTRIRSRVNGVLERFLLPLLNTKRTREHLNRRGSSEMLAKFQAFSEKSPSP